MILRDGTQDMTMLKEVYFDNEYRLPETFPLGSVVLDIGAHVGIFALACWERGADFIDCYEPEENNYYTLVRNTKDYTLIRTFQAAVWRSDREEKVRIVCPGREHGAQTRVVKSETDTINRVGLDEILRSLGKVDLLKLDCEGSEYPILFTSKELHRVKEIVGESHELYPWEASPRGSAGIREFLEKQGFSVEIIPHPGSPEVNHLFFAKRT